MILRFFSCCAPMCVLLTLSIPGYSQKTKLGCRSGVSFSNFYSHHKPGEISEIGFITGNPGGPPIVVDPNAPRQPSRYYETDFISDMRTGFHVSFLLERELNERFSGEIGLGYAQRGINMNYSMKSSTVDANGKTEKVSYQFNQNLRLSYVMVPLTLRYALDKKSRFHVLGGIYNGVLVDFVIKKSLIITERELTSNGNSPLKSESRESFGGAYASLFDSGLIAGADLTWPASQKVLIGIDFKCALGLINLPKKYDQYGFQSFSEKTKNLSFEVGVKMQYVWRE